MEFKSELEAVNGAKELRDCLRTGRVFTTPKSLPVAEGSPGASSARAIAEPARLQLRV
jgi:hypothetical protein